MGNPEKPDKPDDDGVRILLRLEPKVKSVKDDDGNTVIVNNNDNDIEPVLETGIQRADEPPAETSYEYVRGERVRVTKTVEPPTEATDKKPDDEADQELDEILADYLKNMP